MEVPIFFFFVKVTLFLLKSTTSGRFSVKVNTTWPKERDSETRKRTNKERESIVFLFCFVFCFQILLSPHNNHLTALCGLAAASDVEGEREREGGGGGSSCGWTVINPVQYNAAHW